MTCHVREGSGNIFEVGTLLDVRSKRRSAYVNVVVAVAVVMHTYTCLLQLSYAFHLKGVTPQLSGDDGT